MAYEVIYLFEGGSARPTEVMSGAVETLRDSGLDVVLADVCSGDEWIGGELELLGLSTGVSLEVHGADESTQVEVLDAAALPGAPALDDVTALASVTLVGEVNWDVVMHLRKYFIEVCSAHELDERDGFLPRK